MSGMYPHVLIKEKNVKVVEFIKRLNDIGFDENTELTFSCVNGDTGDWFDLVPDTDENDPFSFGEELNGKPYEKDSIDFCLNVDKCEDYLNQKKYNNLSELTEEILGVIGKYERKYL